MRSSAPRHPVPWLVVTGKTRRIMVAHTATAAFDVLRGVPVAQLAEFAWARPALRPNDDKTYITCLALWHGWGLSFASWSAGREAAAVLRATP